MYELVVFGSRGKRDRLTIVVSDNSRTRWLATDEGKEEKFQVGTSGSCIFRIPPSRCRVAGHVGGNLKEQDSTSA